MSSSNLNYFGLIFLVILISMSLWAGSLCVYAAPEVKSEQSYALRAKTEVLLSTGEYFYKKKEYQRAKDRFMEVLNLDLENKIAHKYLQQIQGDIEKRRSAEMFAVLEEQEPSASEEREARLKAEKEEKIRLKREAEERRREQARLKKEQTRKEREEREARLKAEREEALRLKQEAEAKRREQTCLERERRSKEREEKLARLKAEKEEKIRLKREAKERRQAQARLKKEQRRKEREEREARLKAEKEEKLRLKQEREERRQEQTHAEEKKPYLESESMAMRSQEEQKSKAEEEKESVQLEVAAVAEAQEVQPPAQEAQKEEQTETEKLPEKVPEKVEEETTSLRVNLDFTDVALNQILSSITQITDLNIVGGEELSKEISIHLKDVPIEDAFSVILKAVGYTYIKEKNVFWIVPKEEAPLITEVFELKFTSAARIKQAISHLVPADGTVEVFSKSSQGRLSNILVITATRESLENIKELINKLDKEVKQVMIEAKFCEVTLDKDLELGIHWLIQPSMTGATTQTRFPLPALGTKQLDRPAVLTQEEGEITLGTISFANFMATLRALDTDAKIDIISNPRIATKDGEEARIVVGSRVPIPLYERMAQTGLMEVSGYQEERVGVVLKVTPVINRDNTVTLELNPEVSEITGYTGPDNERPIVSTREVSTVFTVGSGRTVVLGGLMKETISKSLRKIPLLGDVPLVGKVFRYRDDAEDRTELLIFITPYILESPQKVLKEAELSD